MIGFRTACLRQPRFAKCRAWLFCLGWGVVVGCAQLHQASTSGLPLRHARQVGQLAFYTDTELPRDHRLLAELTTLQAELARQLNVPESHDTIHIYLFDAAERYQTFLKQYYPDLPDRRAFFMETNSRLVVYAAWSDQTTLDLRHEVTHGYLHAAWPTIPLWLDEGLAEYYEIPSSTVGRINAPHLDLLHRLLQSGWRPSLQRLEKQTRFAEFDAACYAESWAVTHYLMSHAPQTLAAYLESLNTSTPSHFPPINEAALLAHLFELDRRYRLK